MTLPVIVIGFGRYGQVIGRLLLANKITPTLIDHNPDQVDRSARFGYKSYYGDALRLDVLADDSLPMNGPGRQDNGNLHLNEFEAFVITEESEVPHREDLLSITVITVALSALLHGVSASPLARRFGQLAADMGSCEENKKVSEMPMREGHMN